jgi:hypothetical protein
MVRVRGIVFRRFRFCFWVNRDSKSRCELMNLNTNEKVGLTCAKECPVVSRCGMNEPSPAPTQIQSQFGPFPEGPYVTIEKSSKLVTIPRPSVPDYTPDQSTCPHQQSNLKLWHEGTTWGGNIPSVGQNVNVPPFSRILIDQTIIGGCYGTFEFGIDHRYTKRWD